MKRKSTPLTEREWSRVFEIRCRSKRGETITGDHAHLIARAFAEDPERYAALTMPVFEATKPVVR